MADLLSPSWPWFVAGPIIGLMVPALLLLGNRMFGFSSNFRHVCAALAPGRVHFFSYDWRAVGGWNLTFLAGTLLGAILAARVLGIQEVAISGATHDALARLGISDFSGLAPPETFSWPHLLSLRGLVTLVLGGLLVGFGTAYAGGCTSGHAITGLAALERASLLAVAGFFAGGLLATYGLLPLLW